MKIAYEPETSASSRNVHAVHDGEPWGADMSANLRGMRAYPDSVVDRVLEELGVDVDDLGDALMELYPNTQAPSDHPPVVVSLRTAGLALAGAGRVGEESRSKPAVVQSRLPPTPPTPPRMKFTGERGPRRDGVLNFATWNMLADGMSYGEFMTDAGDGPVTVWPVRGPRVLDVCVEAMRSSAVLAVQENDHFFEILHALRESAIADGAGDVIQGG
jgi:hypothetical protein